MTARRHVANLDRLPPQYARFDMISVSYFAGFIGLLLMSCHGVFDANDSGG
jgi:hypothetical protein